MSERVRNQKIDILRGIAAILMVLGHSFIVYPINVADVPWCAATQHFIYTFHMELFFVLAGYVYHCTCYKTYMKKKFLRIAVPYLVFGILGILLKAFGGALVNGVTPIGEGITNLLLYGGGYWFLYVSFLIFAIYPLLDKLLNKNIIIETAVCVLILILSQYAAIPNFLLLNIAVHYLPYFIFGRIAEKLISRGIIPKTLTAVLTLVTYIGLDAYEAFAGKPLGAILCFVRAIAMCCTLYVIAAIFFDAQKESKLLSGAKKLLEDCSKYSLQIYLFNGYLLTILRLLICRILKIESSLVIVMSIWIVDLAVTLIVCNYILPKLPLFAKLCGMNTENSKRKSFSRSQESLKTEQNTALDV